MRQLSTLIFKYQKQQKWQECLSTLDQFIQQGYVPSLTEFNCVINTCGKAQRMEEIHSVYSRMLQLGVQPNVVTYTSMISSHGRAMQIEQAIAIFTRMQVAGVTPNKVTFNALIDACARAGEFDRALDFLDAMEAGGHTPDTTTFTSLVHAFSRAKQVDHALVVLRYMLGRGVKANSATFDGLFQGCINTGQRDIVNELLEMMDQIGIRPRAATWNKLTRKFYLVGTSAATHALASSNPANGVSIPAHIAPLPATCHTAAATTVSDSLSMGPGVFPSSRSWSRSGFSLALLQLDGALKEAPSAPFANVVTLSSNSPAPPTVLQASPESFGLLGRNRAAINATNAIHPIGAAKATTPETVSATPN